MRRTLIGISLVGALGVAMLHAAAGATPVADAAMARDAAAVRALLKQAADVNGAQGDGMTALHWAASNGDAELAQMLVYAGANLRATTRINGYTPLFLASQSGHANVVEVLLEGGADAKAVSTTGSTPLMLAAAAGAVDAARRLLDAGADVNAKESARGQTALMFAAANNRVPVVRLLAERGRRAQGGDQGPRSLRGRVGEEEASRAAARARQNGPRKPQVPGVERGYNYLELIGNHGGVSALHFAARQGYHEAAQVLVEAGADVNQPSGDGEHARSWWRRSTATSISRSSSSTRARIPRLAADNGATPLFAVLNCEWAPKSNYPQPRAQQQQQTTYLEMMTALLEQGADPNARLRKKVWYSGYNSDLSGVEESGATPFWRAAYASDVPAMRLLLAHGADPNIPAMKAAGRVFGNDSTGTREQGCLRAAADPGRRAVGHAAAGGDRRRLRRRIRRELASHSPGGLDAGGQVPRRRARRRRERQGSRRQHRAAPCGGARRRRDDPVPRLQGRRREGGQPRGADHRGYGQRPGAAHAAVSRSARPAREARREEQPQVRVLLI